MSQDHIIQNLGRALAETLRDNDSLTREVEALETETYADTICGSWRMPDGRLLHIRKNGKDCYRVTVRGGGVRTEKLYLYRTGGALQLTDERCAARGGVYYFPESDLLQIGDLGLCSSVDNEREE